MKDKSGWGCLLLMAGFFIIGIPIKLSTDFLEKHDMCYELIPFCESKLEKEEKEFKRAKSKVDLTVKELSDNSSPIKWRKVTEYKAANEGYIYYLGTNSLNGIYLYWDGDIDDPYIYSLDYQAQDKLKVSIYEGADRLELIYEFLDSEEARLLDESFGAW